ncbi:MAG: AMP-binding protein [Actinomycetota bacterium]
MNIVLHLQRQASAHPDRPALLPPNGPAVTFGQLWDQVCRMSAAFRAAGLHPGDRVVVMIPMSTDLYATLLGLIKMGAVAVFVDPWVGMSRIAAFAAFAEPAGFAGVPAAHFLRLFHSELRTLRVTLTPGRRLGAFPASLTLSEALRHNPDPEIFTPDGPGDPALITFTSGSSQTPKGANRTHGFLEAQYQALRRAHAIRDDDVDMPLFPVFALRNLADGIPSVIPDVDFRRIANVRPERILRQIAAHRVTTCTASPAFLTPLILSGSDPGLRRVLTGGAPVSNDTLRDWQRAWPHTQIDIVYGSTEAEPVASVSLPERLAADPLRAGACLCGSPVDGLRARLIRIQPDPVEFTSWTGLAPLENDSGELVVSGEHVCRDYFRNSDAVRECKFTDDTGTCWHRMGDTGLFDSQGRFWLTGRVHNCCFRNGRPLLFQELEARAAPFFPDVPRLAVLEWHNKLLLVLQGRAPRQAPVPLDDLRAADVPMDALYWHPRPLPLDPRHQSKVDTRRILHHIDRHPPKFETP